MNDKQLWDKAYALGTKTSCKKREVGCVVYNKLTNNIVGEGYNLHENGICDCSNQDKSQRTATHAEVMAINSIIDIAGQPKEDLIAYVTRKPCCNCQSIMEDKIGEIRYRN